MMYMGNDANYVRAHSESALEQVRGLLATVIGHLPSDEELDSLVVRWPVLACLFATNPLATTYKFIRLLTDDLFTHLRGLARDFSERSDPIDFATWPREFYELAYFLTTIEKAYQGVEIEEPLPDREVIAAGNALVVVVATETQLRAGNLSFITEYTLTGRRPLIAVPSRPSATCH